MSAYTISRSLLNFCIDRLFKVRFFGKENIPPPPYIVASNHASYLDPPLIGNACRKDSIDFLTKSELFELPVVGAWCRIVDCIEVKRGKNSVKSLREALRRIKNKRSIAIFPEGTRSEDGSLREGKKGAGFIIAAAGVPIIPVYIGGTADAMAKGRGIHPGAEINVYVGKPIMPEEFPGSSAGKKDYGSIAGMVMDRIARIKLLHV